MVCYGKWRHHNGQTIHVLLGTTAHGGWFDNLLMLLVE
jgi:hypothetical protein